MLDGLLYPHSSIPYVQMGRNKSLTLREEEKRGVLEKILGPKKGKY